MMVKRQIRSRGADIGRLCDTVHPRIIESMRTASAELKRLGIRHALAGGLAVGAHGYVRATKDVDFLVGDEAFVRHDSGIVSFAPGFPLTVKGVTVDAIALEGEPLLEAALEHPEVSQDVPIVPVEVLVYMKLTAGRPRDRLDVAELIEAGVDYGAIEAYLRQHAAHLLPDLKAAAAANGER
jgi:hypothetical protein